MHRDEATSVILEAFNLAHPDVRQDMEPFVLRDGRTAVSIVNEQVELVQRTAPSAYMNLPLAARVEARETDFANKKKIVASETCNM